MFRCIFWHICFDSVSRLESTSVLFVISLVVVSVFSKISTTKNVQWKYIGNIGWNVEVCSCEPNYQSDYSNLTGVRKVT